MRVTSRRCSRSWRSTVPRRSRAAIQDAHQYQAYSCEYIANIIEQRARTLPEPGALHLTRPSDLLNLELPEPDLSVYDPKPDKPPTSETNPPMNSEERRLAEHLAQLRLPFIQGNYQPLADQAAREQCTHAQWTHAQYLGRLLDGENTNARTVASHAASPRRAFLLSRLWISSTGTGPKRSIVPKCSISSAFLKDQTNVTFVGGSGLAKNHLAIALSHIACLQGHSVLFTTAVEAINALAAAQANRVRKPEFHQQAKNHLQTEARIMNPIILRISPAAEVHCFYTEAIDLAQIGRLEVRRASTVEFNDQNQQWEVRFPTGLLLYSHPSRAACLSWEQEKHPTLTKRRNQLCDDKSLITSGPATLACCRPKSHASAHRFPMRHGVVGFLSCQRACLGFGKGPLWGGPGKGVGRGSVKRTA